MTMNLKADGMDYPIHGLHDDRKGFISDDFTIRFVDLIWMSRDGQVPREVPVSVESVTFETPDLSAEYPEEAKIILQGFRDYWKTITEDQYRKEYGWQGNDFESLRKKMMGWSDEEWHPQLVGELWRRHGSEELAQDLGFETASSEKMLVYSLDIFRELGEQRAGEIRKKATYSDGTILYFKEIQFCPHTESDRTLIPKARKPDVVFEDGFLVAKTFSPNPGTFTFKKGSKVAVIRDLFAEWNNDPNSFLSWAEVVKNNQIAEDDPKRFFIDRRKDCDSKRNDFLNWVIQIESVQDQWGTEYRVRLNPDLQYLSR
jgi:hypothetical protein